MRLPVLAFSLILGGCSTNGAQPASSQPGESPERAASSSTRARSAEFEGLYSAGFEVSSFRPCGGTERWWVGAPGPLHDVYERIGARPYEEIHVVVRGDTSARGKVGHLGQYARYMAIDSVISARRLDDTTTTSTGRCR